MFGNGTAERRERERERGERQGLTQARQASGCVCVAVVVCAGLSVCGIQWHSIFFLSHTTNQVILGYRGHARYVTLRTAIPELCTHRIPFGIGCILFSDAKCDRDRVV